MRARDQDIRERAIRELGCSIALSAGAGSGKTSVLTDRVLELLVHGTPAGRIAAITFTEKAAGELQARVRDALEHHLAAGRHLPEGLLAELSSLELSTIHGFCQRLLTAESFDAAWAPDTEVLPDILSSPQVIEGYRNWEEGFRLRHPEASLVIYQLISPWTLRETARRLLSYRDLQPVHTVYPFDPAASFAKVEELGKRLFVAALACTNKDHDKLYLATHGLLVVLQDARERSPAEAVVRVLASGEGVSGNLRHGRMADWQGGGKQLFAGVVQQFRSWRAHELEKLHGLVVRDLAKYFLPQIDLAKRRAAVADYDDLLFRAAWLLRERPNARARLAERFDAVLIDEVQDTDPIQAEVAALLTREPDADGEWDAHPPRRGRLFAVGDAQQSIYRFRRADQTTWRQLESLLMRDGEKLALTENFRSVPYLVEWVNTTFGHLPGYQRQRPHRQQGRLMPVVRLPLPPTATDLDELGAIVRYLLELRRCGEVVDKTTQQPRALVWSDVMLLLPSWARADALQDALTRAGIPAVVEGGGSFFERDEIRLATAALECLNEAGDEQSAVFVLRGLFGLTWEDLAKHRAADGAWRYSVPDPPPGPVADAFSLLRSLARRRGRDSWVALLDELLDRSRAAAVWALLRDGEAKLANLDKLRGLIRQFELTARSPAEVLRMLGALDKEQDLSRVDVGEEAVRITSYFKAKGLEAPVVMLCFARRRSEGVQAAVNRRERKVAVKLGALRLVDWERYETEEKLANTEERRRWMYVAATRARDQLVIVDREQNKLIREHLANGLPFTAAMNPALLPPPQWRDGTFADLDPDVDTWLEDPPDEPPEPDPTEQWSRLIRDTITQSKEASTSWKSVHELASRERVSGPSSSVGILGGNLVHAVMEKLDFSGSKEAQTERAEALLPGLARSLGVGPERTQLCRGILLRMLDDPTLDIARSAPEHWVEVPFAYRDDEHERVVSGRIDLAFPTDESRRLWYVVDWKSDLPPRDSPGWRNYQAQLEHYSKAVLDIVPSCEECRAVLVGPFPELDQPTFREQLAELQPELGVGIESLVDKGLPRPRVRPPGQAGAETRGELLWSERKVTLIVGTKAPEHDVLREAGWTIVPADPIEPGWVEAALEQLVRVFGLDA